MRVPARCLPVLMPLGLAALASGTPALQAQNSASLAITVVAADDGKSVRGAEVLIDGADVRRATNDHGFLRLSGLPDGVSLVEVRSLGFKSWKERVSLKAGVTTGLLAELLVDPIALAQLEVEARESTLRRRGFYDRRRTGSGTFITRDQLERMRVRSLSDVLRRVGGIHVGSDSRGLPPARIRGQQTIAGGCPIQYFVDGVATFAMNIDEVRPGDVEGIEIYRGAASIPAAFKRGTASCGVILLWTRVR